MHQVLQVTLYILAVIAVVLLFGVVVAALTAYIGPRLKAVAQGQALGSGKVVECCPPGVGCNDPHSASRKCLRIEARRIAKTEELVQLEQTWSTFSGVPRWHKKERRSAQAAYAAVRDGIVAARLREAAELIDGSRVAALPQHLGGSQGLTGEVMENGTTRQRQLG